MGNTVVRILGMMIWMEVKFWRLKRDDKCDTGVG